MNMVGRSRTKSDKKKHFGTQLSFLQLRFKFDVDYNPRTGCCPIAKAIE
jgi:hypothetical protein